MIEIIHEVAYKFEELSQHLVTVFVETAARLGHTASNIWKVGPTLISFANTIPPISREPKHWLRGLIGSALWTTFED
jgi:hypothetical protein